MRIGFIGLGNVGGKLASNLFNNNFEIANKLKVDLNLRPQNLNFETYYNLTKEYENLRS